MADTETRLDQPIGGLFMMIVFTVIWIVLAEYYFDNADYRTVSIIFGAAIAYLIYYYWTFSKQNTRLPKMEKIKDPKKERLFWIVFVLEGVAIFLTAHFLINFGKQELFISGMALIVGLHFIPLANVFDRKFHYYIGIWTTSAAIVALILIMKSSLDYTRVNAFLCVACAVSTTVCGLHMIGNGKKLLSMIDE